MSDQPDLLFLLRRIEGRLGRIEDRLTSMERLMDQAMADVADIRLKLQERRDHPTLSTRSTD